MKVLYGDDFVYRFFYKGRGYRISYKVQLKIVVEHKIFPHDMIGILNLKSYEQENIDLAQ